MPGKERIPVTVYQIDLSLFNSKSYTDVVDEIRDKVKKKKGSFDEESVTANLPEEYQVRIFSFFRSTPPQWAGFLAPLVNSDSDFINNYNFMNSFVCFIGYSDNIFALTGGGGSLAIEDFIDQNFGLEILIRVLDKNEKVVKAIQERGLTGSVLGETRFYRGDQRLADENRFGKIYKLVSAELDKSILRKDFKFSNDDLKRGKSGCWAKSSFQLGKSIDFFQLLKLIKEFTSILLRAPKFTLNKVTLISRKNNQNASILFQLKNTLVKKLFDSCQTNTVLDFDLCHRLFEKYLTAQNFVVRYDRKDILQYDRPPDIKTLFWQLKRSEYWSATSELEFRHFIEALEIVATDENGSVATCGDLMKHLHGEISYNNDIFFYVDNDWYKVKNDFVLELNNSCSNILANFWDNKLVDRKFNICEREGLFNAGFVDDMNTFVLDTIVHENIEACDILKYDENGVYLIHVKKGFDNSIRELVSQILISARRIQQDISTGYSYLDEVEKRCRRHFSTKKLPKDRLKDIFKERRTHQIYFCLAFVDTAKGKRVLKDQIGAFDSNIAKFSLVELKRELTLMDFGFKVIQFEAV